MTCTKMTHSSHLHELTKLNHRTTYNCNGCKEPGWRTGYSCGKCNYHLHEDCALHSSSMSHPFLKNGVFKFLERVPGPHNRYCKACGKQVLGYAYHCHKTGDNLHPVCAKFPLTSQSDGVDAHLKKKISKQCAKCGRRGTMIPSNKGSWNKVKCWSIKYTTNGEEFHLACFTELMVNHFEMGSCLEPERNSLAIDITNVPNFHLASVSAGNSWQSSNWAMTRKLGNLLRAFIFGDHAAGMVTLAASAASAASMLSASK